MKQKLLNKTLRIYIVFSILILGITAPLFYFLTKNIQLNEADEMLMLRKHEFESLDLPSLKESDIVQWNLWNRDSRIEQNEPNISGMKFQNANYINSMDGDEEPYRILLSPIQIENKTYTYFAKINLIEAEDTLFSIGILYFSIIFLLLIGLFIITKKYSVSLWNPFMKTLEELEKYDLMSQAKLELSESSIDEFHRMNLAIERLIARNVSVYNTQKEFVENAAHELQTPLAIMRTKLDSVMQNDLGSNAAANIETMNYALERLTQLNKNLLLLSRIEYDAYSGIEKVSVNQLIQRQIEFLSEQFTDIKTVKTIKDDYLLITNPSLLEICLGNLLVNAFRHNTENGIVEVVLAENSITIINSAVRDSLDEKRLFLRFSKNDSSKPGTGLGLAIVKRIVDLNHWTINYKFENNTHIFCLSFH